MAQQNPYQPPAASLERAEFGGQPGHWEIGQAINTGWELFKANIGVVLVGVIIYFGISFAMSFVISLVISLIQAAIQQAGMDPDVMLAIVFSIQFVFQIGVVLIDTYLMLGLIKLMLNVARGGPEQAQITDVFSGGSVLLKGIGAQLLLGLVVMLGFLLLFVPGIILSLGLSFTIYLVVDRQLGPIEALKESWRITDGHKVNLFLFGLVAALVMLAGALACGIGWLVAWPVVMLAQAFIYCQLTGTGRAAGVGQPAGFGPPPGGGFGAPPGGGFGAPPSGGFGAPPGGGFGAPPGGGFGAPPGGGGFGAPPGGGFGGSGY
jgi:hypothetical protein